MAAYFALAAYLGVGLLLAQVILCDKRPLLRIWLGLSLGVLLLMWLPALAAFAVGFTLAAEWIALGVLALLSCAILYYQKKTRVCFRAFDKTDRSLLIALAAFVVPLTIASAYMQYTHTLRNVNGALHVGQATYGDLCMHLSIVTGLRGAKLPTEYTILPGSPLGYPFLTDAMSTSLYILGMPLALSITVPGTLMCLLVYSGFLLLAYEMSGRVSVAVLASALLFFNGGLGFLYDFDLSGSDLSKIQEIFTGFYKTPANQPDLNLRWSNLVADLLLPQRTFLGGWTLLLPALYLVREAFKKGELRLYLLTAVFAVALPLVHAHSLVALAIFSGCALFYMLITRPDMRRATLIGAGAYLGIVVLLGLPQLLGVTMRQATNEGFISLHVGWVNRNGTAAIDFPIWFWLKNVGLPLIAMVLAVLDWKKEHRMDLIGAAAIFIVADIIQFQPLAYDNNKLFYIWFLLTLPAASDWCVSLYDRMKGQRSRVLLAALFVTVSTLSGALSIARECAPDCDYELFSAADAEAGRYIDENTDTDAMFVTGQHHQNVVYALAGRKVVCGPPLFLHWHGLPYQGRQAEVTAFYADPANHLDLIARYGVDYVVVSNWERYSSDLIVDEAALDALFPVVYDQGGFKLYKVGAEE